MKSALRHSCWVFAVLAVIPFSAGRARAFSLRDTPVTLPAGSAGSFSTEAAAAFLSSEDSGGSTEPTKSKSKAILYSLILPGWGHYYVGDKSGAAAFLTIEALTWTSFAVFEIQGHLRKQGYEDYAQVFAGIASGGHSDDYYGIVAEYDSWADYADAVKSEGRFALYPDVGGDVLEEYFIENRVSDYEPWVWQSADARRDFRSLRSDSKLSYRRGLYAVAVAAANRVASAFFVIKATNDANRALGEPRVGYRVEFGPPVYHPGDGAQTGVSFVATF
jgi:hypothetical protein